MKDGLINAHKRMAMGGKAPVDPKTMKKSSGSKDGSCGCGHMNGKKGGKK